MCFAFAVWTNDGATIGNRFYGVNGANKANAAMVLGELSTAGARESSIFEEFIAHSQPSDPSKFAGIHQSTLLARRHSSARLTIHHRHNAIHFGELQLPLVARY